MSAIRDWECAAHGAFEKRTKSAQDVPKCPKGCSKGMVKLVFLQAVGHVSGRTRTADRLVKEMAAAQGLSDISTSPSRPGGSVAQRNRMRNRGVRGPQGHQYPAHLAAQAAGGQLKLGGAAGAGADRVANWAGVMPAGNTLTGLGFGHEYNAAEWKTDDKTGKVKHIGAQGAVQIAPPASVERVREGRR